MNGTHLGVRAVLFDVYGTLLEIRHPLHPYQRLLDMASNRGGAVDRALARRALMTKPMSLQDAAKWLGLQLTTSESIELHNALAEELASICLYPDVAPTLKSLRHDGIKIGLCSNLASPYIEPARRHLATYVDACVWSCEVGYVKPAREIFEHAISSFKVPAKSVLMVGDTPSSDVEGAIAAGMGACHLDRTGTSKGAARIGTLLDLIS